MDRYRWNLRFPGFGDLLKQSELSSSRTQPRLVERTTMARRIAVKGRAQKAKKARKGPDRRKQIIAAASELFASKGFEGTSIRDIAAASGVLSGSLFSEPWQRLEEAIVAHCNVLLGGSVTRAILTPPRYYTFPGVKKLVRQRDEYEQIFAGLIDDLPLSKGCDRQAFRLSLLGAMNWTVFWFNSNGRLKAEEVGRQIALMVRGADAGASNGKKRS